MRKLSTLLLLAIMMNACVSNKKYSELKAENDRLKLSIPVQEAKKELEASVVRELQDKVNHLEMEIQSQREESKKMYMMIAAGEIQMPTPAQLRMYELQLMDKAQQGLDPGIPQEKEPRNTIQPEIKGEIQQQDFRNRLAVEALKTTLNGYNSKQVSINETPGKRVVSISAEELFEAGKSELSASGITLVAKIAAALSDGTPVNYNLNALSKGEQTADMVLATARAAALFNALKEHKSKVALPKNTGATLCSGNNSISCDRIELSFEYDYDAALESINQLLQP